MAITHVIRGEDHITNTARQMMLFAALGREVPRYGHHSLILAPDGSKMSKRHGATSIGDFKGLGYLSGAIVNYLALLSWHPTDEREKFTLAELIEEFDIGRVSKSPAIFDIQKLNGPTVSTSGSWSRPRSTGRSSPIWPRPAWRRRRRN